MANWAKDNSGGTGYYNIGQVWRAYTAQWTNDPTKPNWNPAADMLWYIWVSNGISDLKIDGPYPDKATADSTLATAITNLGGAA